MVDIQSYLGVMNAYILFLNKSADAEDGGRWNFLGLDLTQHYGGHTDSSQEWREGASRLIPTAQPVTVACDYLPTTPSFTCAHKAVFKILYTACGPPVHKDIDNLEHI